MTSAQTGLDAGPAREQEALAAVFVVVSLLFPLLALAGRWGVRGKLLKQYLMIYGLLVTALLLTGLPHSHSLYAARGPDGLPLDSAWYHARQIRLQMLIFAGIFLLMLCQQNYLNAEGERDIPGSTAFLLAMAFFLLCGLSFFNIRQTYQSAYVDYGFNHTYRYPQSSSGQLSWHYPSLLEVASLNAVVNRGPAQH